MRNIEITAALGACCLLAACEPPKPSAPPSALKVQVITVTPRDVPVMHEWVGTLDGYPNAVIRAQVAGYLVQQVYTEGSAVHKGDRLFEIDPRSFEAALGSALAKQQQDEALAAKTQLDVVRYTPLAKTQAVSQQTLDDAVQANLAAKAAVAADKSAVETARLNLSFTRVVAPVDGIAGLAAAQIGDLVGPTTGALTTVSTVDPIRAYFNISESFYLELTRPAAGGAKRVDPPLEMVLSDGSVYPLPGRWAFTDRQVEPTTGTIKVAAIFENPGNRLRPGLYARLRARTDVRKNALLVPQRAVMELQGAAQVALVDPAGAVHIKTVRLGDQVGGDWVVESGLQAQDRVVAEGTLKVKEGMKVEVEDYPAPPAASPEKRN